VQKAGNSQVGLQRDLVALGSGLAAAEMGREWRQGAGGVVEIYPLVMTNKMVFNGGLMVI